MQSRRGLLPQVLRAKYVPREPGGAESRDPAPHFCHVRSRRRCVISRWRSRFLCSPRLRVHWPRSARNRSTAASIFRCRASASQWEDIRRFGGPLMVVGMCLISFDFASRFLCGQRYWLRCKARSAGRVSGHVIKQILPTFLPCDRGSPSALLALTKPRTLFQLLVKRANHFLEDIARHHRIPRSAG